MDAKRAAWFPAVLTLAVVAGSSTGFPAAARAADEVAKADNTADAKDAPWAWDVGTAGATSRHVAARRGTARHGAARRAARSELAGSGSTTTRVARGCNSSHGRTIRRTPARRGSRPTAGT